MKLGLILPAGYCEALGVQLPGLPDGWLIDVEFAGPGPSASIRSLRLYHDGVTEPYDGSGFKAAMLRDVSLVDIRRLVREEMERRE